MKTFSPQADSCEHGPILGAPEQWKEGVIFFLLVGKGEAVMTIAHLLYVPKASSN